MPSVTVCGSSHAAVTPDRATIDLGLTHVATTAGAAMDRIAELTNGLEQCLTTLGFDRRDWSTQGVSLAEEWEWKNDSNTRIGFRATIAVCVAIIDLDRVGRVITAAVDQVGAQIRNLAWHVAADNEARHALLGAAALDAKRRASAYVEALGLQLGGVEEISEIAPAATLSGPPELGLRAKSFAVDATMSVNAAEVDIHASVYIRFTVLTKS